MLKQIKITLKKSPIIIHIYRIFKLILLDKLNKGSKISFLFNYLYWYSYLKPKNKKFIVTLQNGIKSIVYSDSDSGVSNIFTRNVDYYENQFIRKVINKNDFIIDAGCNVGNRTLVLADIISGGLLIDANEKCIDRVKENFELNKIPLEKFHLLVNAVGSEEKIVYFSDLGGTSCMNKIVTDTYTTNNIKSVKMITIDSEMAKIGDPKCTFIKTDLEGNDLDALIGAKRTLTNNFVKLVKFETPREHSLDPFKKFFDELDWIIFTLDKNGDPTKESHLVDVALNLFAMPKEQISKINIKLKS